MRLRYVQLSVAVPLTMGELFVNCVPTVTINCDGALAVIVAVPTAIHVAVPSPLMPAIALFEDFQVRPSAWVS